MELSSEDSLRLNVLLANAQAVRINEHAMCVYGLSPSGEARVQLNPTCRADRYLRFVREMLSSAVLGSPGGYPVYLKRWTRMGNISSTRLEDLLLLGEPEAVVAVTRSPGLTDELARRAWWSMPDAENARRMLRHPAVLQGAMGRTLADFLVEFLPFEEDAHKIIESVRLVLQPGLIDDSTRESIWERGRKKNVFLVGFLQALADDLPDPVAPHSDYERYRAELENLGARGNSYAVQLHRTLAAPGQTFLRSCASVLQRPSNQDVVVEALNAIGEYFGALRTNAECCREIAAIGEYADGLVGGARTVEGGASTAIDALCALMPDASPKVGAMIFLAHVGEPVVRSIFAQTDAVGSLMRKKVEPVVLPVLNRIALLRSDT